MDTDPLTSSVTTKPAASAQQILASIENRTIHVLSHLQTAVSLLLNRQTADNLVIWDESLRDRLTVENLETHLKHWKYLLPQDTELLASLVRVFLAKYPFQAGEHPQLAQHLKLNDSELQKTYKSLFNEYLTATKPVSRHQPNIQNTVNQLTDMLLQDDMGSQLEWLSLHRGETLLHEGDEGDGLYVVMDGLVRVTTESPEGDTLVVELGRGEVVGEVALLTGEKRTANVYAARDTQLCKLSKAGFDFLVNKYPMVMTQIALQMARRILRQDRHHRKYARPVTLTIVPLSHGITDFVQRLVNQLGRYGTTVHLNRESIANLYPEQVQVERLDQLVDDFEFVAWLNRQESQAQFVIYEADLTPSPWTRRCIEQADRLLLVALADESPQLSPIEEIILGRQDPKLVVQHELVLLHPTQNRMPSGTQAWLTPRNVTRHHHIALDSNVGLERLVRFIRGRAIGVVFGGGGMRGSAHGGAIRAIQEMGIPVDFVGGTSAGSVAATQFAMGWTVDKMVEINRTRLFNNRILLDYTFPIVALTAGHRFNTGLTQIYGEQLLEDLWINCFCISTNLTYGRIRVHQNGLIRRATRASTAMPGLYPPVLDDNGDVLVDGGLINNMPVDVMKAAVDGGIVIGVDVSREMGRRTDFDFGDSLSGWQVLLNRINPFTKTKRYPSMIKTLIRSSTIANESMTAGKAELVDLYLKPPVDRFGLLDAASYLTMYDIGYKYAKEALTEWVERGGLPA